MTPDLGFWTLQTLNALQLSMLLFLLSIGLTVIFGLMHFVNLAHGALYALGAYFAATIASTAGFWVALLVAPLGVAVVGMALYGGLISRMRKSGPMAQVLVTFGLIFVLLDLTRIFWGDLALAISPPAILSGRVDVFGTGYPAYRLFIIALGAVIFAALALILSRTQIGAMIRAGVDNDAMAACMGINVERLFFIVFCVGGLHGDQCRKAVLHRVLCGLRFGGSCRRCRGTASKRDPRHGAGNSDPHVDRDRDRRAWQPARRDCRIADLWLRADIRRGAAARCGLHPDLRASGGCAASEARGPISGERINHVSTYSLALCGPDPA